MKHFFDDPTDEPEEEPEPMAPTDPTPTTPPGKPWGAQRIIKRGRSIMIRSVLFIVMLLMIACSAQSQLTVSAAWDTNNEIGMSHYNVYWAFFSDSLAAPFVDSTGAPTESPQAIKSHSYQINPTDTVFVFPATAISARYFQLAVSAEDWLGRESLIATHKPLVVGSEYPPARPQHFSIVLD